MTLKLQVANDAYNAAIENPDINNLIIAEGLKYRAVLDEDERRETGLHALWRCLRSHNPKAPSKRRPGEACNQKFTTSLYKFLHWEYKRAVEKKFRRLAQERKRRHRRDVFDVPEAARKSEHRQASSARTDLEYVRECLKYLPTDTRRVLHEHFVEGRTVEEIGERMGVSKETTRQKLTNGVACLREFAADGVLSDG